MPRRLVPFINGEIYHLYNRGHDGRTLFRNDREYRRFCHTLAYYQIRNQPYKLSRYLELNRKHKMAYRQLIAAKEREVCCLAHCLMPNHFHVLIQQKQTGGISKFMSQVLNSYTRYFNTKSERKGAIFEGQFKSVLVESDEQLLHTTRYIHLNPYAGFLIKDVSDVWHYPWSSAKVYMGELDEVDLVKLQEIEKALVSLAGYREFVEDRADYQKSLKEYGKLFHLRGGISSDTSEVEEL